MSGAADGGPDLAGLDVLAVEDETLVAMLLEHMLTALGCNVVGPVLRLARAVEIVDSGQPLDAAVLDVNIGGERIFGVAERLLERGVPLVFATGYGADVLPEMYRACGLLPKPYQQEDVERALKAALRAQGRAD